MFGGAVSWGLIAVIVYYPVGRGDMAGLPAIAAGVTCAVAGTVAGLIAGLLGKLMKSPGHRGFSFLATLLCIAVGLAITIIGTIAVHETVHSQNAIVNSIVGLMPISRSRLVALLQSPSIERCLGSKSGQSHDEILRRAQSQMERFRKVSGNESHS